MHAGIGADATLRPVRRRPRLVVLLQGGVVVRGVIPEEGPDLAEPRAALDQAIPVVVPAFVPEMAEDGAVGFGHPGAHLLADDGVGLGDVERD